MTPRGSLRRMLEARSVAVVGASLRKGSVGRTMLEQLAVGGFDGPVAAVNPKYDDIDGIECYPSLGDVPFEIDLVLLGVPNRALAAELENAAARGAGAAVIFASGYERPNDPSLVERLRAIATAAGIAICGGNCMGFINFDARLRALAFAEPDAPSGGIAWITHSGSAFSALLHNDRDLRFNLAVSAGQELTTTVSDYVSYALELPSTRAIALFLETVRDPDRFTAALADAWDRDVPVVALKVGRAPAARDLVLTHSGALAGEDAAYDAVFDEYGVARAATMNEMADALELLVAGRPARRGGLTALHDSGGERAHLIDVAADVGIRFAQISPRTTERLAGALDPGLAPGNPLDAWGTGDDHEEVFLTCMATLADDEDAGALAFAVDLAGEDLEWGYANVAEAFFERSEIAFAVVSNLGAAIDQDAAARLRRRGIPVLEDTANGLRAFKHLFARRDHRTLPLRAASEGDSEARARWIELLRKPEPPTHLEALSLLADYGIDVAPARRATTLDDALAAAAGLYPVALKTADPGIAHKADVGGVLLGVADDGALAAEYRALEERLGPDVLVQPMAPNGVELGFGIVHDSQFGPLVVVASGGLLIEVMRDRRLVVPPLDAARAQRALDGLAARRMLDGIRGNPPSNVDAVIDTVIRLSRIAVDLGDHIDSLDVNPVIAGPQRCVAVDCVVLPRVAPG